MARPKVENYKSGKHIVYRYIDNSDNQIKYVGITYKDGMRMRIYNHCSMDEWNNKGLWRIEYFECDNKSEAEAFESHLISLYGTDKYYNKQKSGWGINKYLPSVEDKWQLWQDAHFADFETMEAAKIVRNLIKLNYFKEALILLDCFEFEEMTKDE